MIFITVIFLLLLWILNVDLATEIKKDYYLNLALVIDTSWPADEFENILSGLMENEVVFTPYKSNTTIICGGDGNILYQGSDAINWSSYLKTTKCVPGLDESISLTAVEDFFSQLYLDEQQSCVINKGAYAALFLPYSASTTHNITYILDKKKMFDTILPDIKLLVAASGTSETFSALVSNVTNDVFTISNDETAIDSVTQIANRLREIPMRLSSPKCGKFDGVSAKGFLIDDVQIGYSKLYLLQPNYFFLIDSAPKISIRCAQNETVPLTVCVSRADPTPTGTDPGGNYSINPNQPVQRYNQNNRLGNGGLENSNSDCIIVNQTALVALKLPVSPCDGYYSVSSCPPIYIKITAALPTVVPNSYCKNCRYFTNAEYEITLDELSCSSGSEEKRSNLRIAWMGTGIALVLLYLCFVVLCYNLHRPRQTFEKS